MRCVFFGTPEFAVPSLRALVEEGFDVVTVITQPDRAQGRSRSKLLPPAVKTVAEEHGLTVHQPERPSAPSFADVIRAVEPDIGVVVAYGHLLKRELFAVPRLGMVNVHASLLPSLRGAAPIEYAILEGLDETGISIMQIEDGLDSGPVIHHVTTPVAPDETSGELSVRLSELGALALIEALALLSTDSATVQHQDEDRVSYAPKITREVTRVRWEEPANLIARQSRAFDPVPGAWSQLNGREIKLFGPGAADDWDTDDVRGEILETDPAFVVSTGDGALQFLDVQPAGRQRMSAREWLRGRGAAKGDRFE